LAGFFAFGVELDLQEPDDLPVLCSADDGVLNFGTVFPQPNFLAAASKAILSMSSFTAMAGEEGLYFFFKEERTGKIP